MIDRFRFLQQHFTAVKIKSNGRSELNSMIDEGGGCKLLLNVRSIEKARVDGGRRLKVAKRQIERRRRRQWRRYEGRDGGNGGRQRGKLHQLLLLHLQLLLLLLPERMPK